MTFKQSALKLLSCGLRTREDEDRVEVAEAIAWSIWALMEQARYEDVDVADECDTCAHRYGEYNACDPQTTEIDCNTLHTGDRVKYGGNDHIAAPEYYPPPGTVGVVNRVCDNRAQVQWPAGSTSRDDLWYADLEDITLVEDS